MLGTQLATKLDQLSEILWRLLVDDKKSVLNVRQLTSFRKSLVILRPSFKLPPTDYSVLQIAACLFLIICFC
jgi:hypothetical protein